MTRVLRSAAKKIQNSEDLSSKLSISKKSKNIKKTDNKALEIKNENNQQNSVWNINTILSNIFAYTDRKDLVEFNTVCKKWNNLSNPIIHKTIKLDSRWDAEWQQHYNKNNNATKINTDVVECISNNAKHAHLVKEFKFSYKMNPQRAVEIFETFRFIVNLTIENCKINQNQFLGMISPLVQLKELTLRNLSIKNIIKKKPHKEVVQLPPSLKKLILGKIELIDNPELFVQAINSHRNLVEFKYDTDSNDNNFIEPFYKHYPSLLNFEFNYIWLESSQPLFAIFENNTQLVSLKLTLKCLSSELLSKISSNLIELEELKLSKNPYYSREDTEFFAKFSQPTKIKNLKLDCGRLSNCSLNSILLNCPQLEELDLNRITNMQRNSVKFISFSNPLKLKKLAIDCDDLSEGVFESILLNCQNINELKIVLPCKWEVAIQSIYEKCANLERLDISPYFQINEQERNSFFEEFYKTEFFTGNPKCKSTLTNLTLNQFKAHKAKGEYFKNFEKLKSIKYPKQFTIYRDRFNKIIQVNTNLWPGYKLLMIDNNNIYDVELKRCKINKLI